MGKVSFKELWAFEEELRKEFCVEETGKVKAPGRGERRRLGKGGGYLLLGRKNCQVHSKHVMGMVRSKIENLG